MVAVTPVQTWLFARDHRLHGRGRPEARFLLSLGVVWLFPISLFWFAFTCDGKTSYWSPLVAGAALGFAEAMIWLSMLNYVTGDVLVPFALWILANCYNRLVSQRCCVRNSRLSYPLIRHLCGVIPCRHLDD